MQDEQSINKHIHIPMSILNFNISFIFITENKNKYIITLRSSYITDHIILMLTSEILVFRSWADWWFSTCRIKLKKIKQKYLLHFIIS